MSSKVKRMNYTMWLCLFIQSSIFSQVISYGNSPQQAQYLTVNGIKIYCEVHGTGKPLLWLHGGFQTMGAFKNQMPDFLKKYKIILLDTRGHGKSTDNPKQRLTYDLFADDVKMALDILKLDSVFVVGWSDGGNTGLILAMKYPQKVSKLCVSGANIFSGKEAVTDAMLNDWLQQQASMKKQPESFRKRMNEMFLTEPKYIFANLKKIQCPTLIMAGEKDIIRENHTRQIASHIKQAKLIIFPKETHFVVTQNPKLFNKTVLEFLEKE